jgi:hypothetical protein
MRPIVYALTALALALVSSVNVYAQEASQVSGYYRQYSEALARNDLPAAETAAEAGLFYVPIAFVDSL